MMVIAPHTYFCKASKQYIYWSSASNTNGTCFGIHFGLHLTKHMTSMPVATVVFTPYHSIHRGVLWSQVGLCEWGLMAFIPYTLDFQQSNSHPEVFTAVPTQRMVNLLRPTFIFVHDWYCIVNSIHIPLGHSRRLPIWVFPCLTEWILN